MKLAIVVPAYEEEEVIEDFVRVIMAARYDRDPYFASVELVIVDDGSKDKTAEILARLKNDFLNLTVLTHEANKGLGMALNTGIAYARNVADVVVTMDADLTHPPSIVPELVFALKDADVSVASRYVAGGGMQDVPWWRVAISKAANFVFRTFYGIKAKDVTAGFKAYKSEAVKDITLERPGFVVQLEIMVKLAKKGCKFAEIPLVLVNRKQGSSKFRFFRMVPKYAVQAIGLFFVRWF